MNKYILCTIIFLNFKLCTQTFYKIAFLKQVFYQDLYCNFINSKLDDLIFSTFKRSGPVALFTKFKADFYIVNVEPDPECNIWKSKVKDPQSLLSLKTQIKYWGKIAKHNFSQGHYSIDCSKINWSKYDIVITIDTAVPARITKKYPKILWAYYIGEGTQPEYYLSYNNPIKGYDCFLTQDCSLITNFKKHVIEFPYHLQYFGCFHKILKLKESSIKRKGSYLECHTRQYLKDNKKLSQLKNISIVKFSDLNLPLKSLILDQMTTKYFIQYVESNTNIRSFTRGNAIIEAIAAGNLVIAKETNVKNKDILTSRTIVKNYDQLLKIISYFQENPLEYEKELQLQRRNLNYLCFERPIKELFEKAKIKNINHSNL